MNAPLDPVNKAPKRAMGGRHKPPAANLTGRSGVAAILGIDRREVRRLEEQGILRPAVVQANGVRWFDIDTVWKLAIERQKAGKKPQRRARPMTGRVRGHRAGHRRRDAPDHRVVRRRPLARRGRPAVGQDARDDPVPVRAVHHPERRTAADDGSLSAAGMLEGRSTSRSTNPRLEPRDLGVRGHCPDCPPWRGPTAPRPRRRPLRLRGRRPPPNRRPPFVVRSRRCPPRGSPTPYRRCPTTTGRAQG